MPYIKQEDRKIFNLGFEALPYYPCKPGDLQYFIALLIERYMKHTEASGYQMHNDIIGALEGAKLEFYRRQVAKYEDQKIIDNGDVY